MQLLLTCVIAQMVVGIRGGSSHGDKVHVKIIIPKIFKDTHHTKTVYKHVNVPNHDHKQNYNHGHEFHHAHHFQQEHYEDFGSHGGGDFSGGFQPNFKPFGEISSAYGNGYESGHGQDFSKSYGGGHGQQLISSYGEGHGHGFSNNYDGGFGYSGSYGKGIGGGHGPRLGLTKGQKISPKTKSSYATSFSYDSNKEPKYSYNSPVNEFGELKEQNAGNIFSEHDFMSDTPLNHGKEEHKSYVTSHFKIETVPHNYGKLSDGYSVNEDQSSDHTPAPHHSQFNYPPLDNVMKYGPGGNANTHQALGSYMPLQNIGNDVGSPVIMSDLASNDFARDHFEKYIADMQQLDLSKELTDQGSSIENDGNNALSQYNSDSDFNYSQKEYRSVRPNSRSAT